MKVKALIVGLVVAATSLLNAPEVKASGFNYSVESGTNCRSQPSTNSRVVRTFSKGVVRVDTMLMGDDGYGWGLEAYNNCWVRADLLTDLGPGHDANEVFLYHQSLKRNQTSHRASGRRLSIPRSGRCVLPSDRDSRGRRCGRRAASVR